MPKQKKRATVVCARTRARRAPEDANMLA